MRPRHLSPFWIFTLALLLVFVWTLTESGAVTLRVANDLCTAELYGRSSTLPCPGLTGGTLAAYSGKSKEPIGHGRGPLGRLAPGSAWASLAITDESGRELASGAPLPGTFTVRGVVRRSDEPSGLVLLRQNSDFGYAFLPDGTTRRGIWWEWSGGEPVKPIQGVPFDKPFIAQLQSFAQLLLGGWQGAILILLAAWLAFHLLKFVAMRSTKAGVRIPTLPPKALPMFAVLFVFFGAIHVSVDVLERIPHVQDSVTYLFQAQTIAHGHLTAPAPPLAEIAGTPHFDQEFLLVRDGRWFGKYPPGYPVILTLGVLAGAHWLVNPLLAALTVPLVYVLARILYRTEQPTTPDPLNTGPWSLLLLATSPFFLIMSGSLMAHPAELFWTVLFMVAWSRAVLDGHSQWALIAGAALGMLFLTRQYSALLIGLSFGAGWAVIATLQTHRQRPENKHRNIRGLLRVTLPLFLIAAAPFFLAIPAYQSAVTGDAFTDPRLLYWPYDRVGFGPGSGESQNAFTFVDTIVGPAQQWNTDPIQPPRGNTPSLGLYNLGRNLESLADNLFAWPPLLVMAFIWLAFLLRRPAPADWVLLLVFATVAAGYLAYWASGIAYGPRYLYPALPALVILSARGITALAARTDKRVVDSLVLILAVYGLVTLPTRMEAYRGYNFVDARPRASIEQAVALPALVFVVVSPTDWWEYGSFFSGNTPWLDGDVIYARDLGAAENRRLRDAFPVRAAYLWRDGILAPITD